MAEQLDAFKEFSTQGNHEILQSLPVYFSID